MENKQLAQTTSYGATGNMLDMKNVTFDLSIDLICSVSPRERCNINAKFGLVIKRVVLESIRSIHPSVDERKINGDIKRDAVKRVR